VSDFVPSKVLSLNYSGGNLWNAIDFDMSKHIASSDVIDLDNSPAHKAWQKKAFDALRYAKRFIVQAVPGAGKSMLAMFLVVDRIIQSDYKKKGLILVPQQQLSKSFLDACNKKRIRIDGKEYAAGISFDCCKDSSAKQEKLYSYLTKQPKDLKAQINTLMGIATHYNFVTVWERMTVAERRACVKNLFLMADECHHLSYGEQSEEMTKLGKIFNEILSYREETLDLGMLTATYFRGDNMDILSSEVRKEFSKYTLHWDEYYPTLGIKEFNFSFDFYDKDPLPSICERVRTDSSAHHLIILPKTGDRFRTADTLKTYRSAILKIIDTVTEVVSETGKKHNFTKLNENPDSYHAVIACDKFNEGTDWPPCDRIHNTACGQSLPRQYQINGRAFRHYANKDRVEVTNYLQKREKCDTLREMLSDYFNTLMIAVMIDETFNPVMLPNLPAAAKKRGESSSRLSDILEDKYVDFKFELFAHYESMGGKNQDIAAVRSVVESVVEGYWSADLGVSKDTLCLGALGLLYRANKNRKEGHQATEPIECMDVSFIRDNIDKIWIKENILGNLVFGTVDPLPPEFFSEYRAVLEKKKGELSVDSYRCKNLESNINLNHALQRHVEKTPVRDLTGKWARLKSTTKVGRVLSISDKECCIRVYTQVKAESVHIVCYRSKGELFVYRDCFWVPKNYANIRKDKLPSSLVKKFIPDEKLRFEDRTVQMSDISQVLN
jgi:superfamily II DNA or RNA helicase